MESDKTIVELADNIVALREVGVDVYFKWTCPGCGERVTADEPNQFHAGSYVHTEKLDGTPCGHIYEGGRYGLLAVYKSPVEGGYS